MCVILCYATSLLAHTSVQDSLRLADSTINLTANKVELYKPTVKEIVIPTAIFGVAALSVNNPWLVKQRNHIQDALSAKGKHKIKFDDYAQYTQMLAVYGLNLCGVQGRHSFKDRTILLATSYATMGILVNSMKRIFREQRPDTQTRNSFPSGHTATAFMGAEFLYQEYKNVSPWIGYSGYALAALTGYLRIYNNRHYINDVLAGACIGMLSTKFAYWLYPRIFKKSYKHNAQTQIAALPYLSPESIGAAVCLRF